MSGTVYFMADTDYQFMKVGFSRNVQRRLAQIQDGGPLKLFVVDQFPGNVNDERAVHDLLKEHRIRGEWFQPEAVLDFLEDAEMARQRIFAKRYFKPAIHTSEKKILDDLDKVTLSEIFFERAGLL